VPGADGLAVAASLVLGYVLGSLPLSALVGRAAGMPPDPAGQDQAGVAAVGRSSGRGWGFLALVADLARGVLPVTLAAATFSWSAGVAAGFGAVAGALWPALGRIRVGRAPGVLPSVGAGALVALAPVVAVAAGAIALAALGVRRRLRRAPKTGP